MMTSGLRSTLRGTLAAAIMFVLATVPAFAQPFPSKSVLIVVPFPPGGVTDTLARALAKELGTFWGQSVVVENISGAGTIIGTSKVTNAPPDGHTLLLTTDPTVVSNRYLYKKLAYDPDKSLLPITMVARSGQLIVANPSFPASNIRDLVNAARAAPGKVAYSSLGIGTSNNLFYETLAKREGVELLHVPYKGIAPATTAALTGEVQLTLAAPGVVGSLLKAGRLKALAISGAQRSAQFPDIPTMAESGFAYATSVIWWGLFAPAGTGAALVDRLHHDVVTITNNVEFKKKYIAPAGIDLVANSPAEFASAIRSDVKTIGEMVKAAGVQPE